MYSLNFSSNFQLFKSFFPSFGDCSKCTNHTCCHPHVPHFSQFASKFKVVVSIFAFFDFYLVVCRYGKIHYTASSLFPLIITWSGVQVRIRWSICISKFQRILCVPFSGMNSGLCICCILTFVGIWCSSCINYVIAGCTCVNKQKHVTWVKTRICGHYEIIYTQLTVDMGSLAEVSHQSGKFGFRYCQSQRLASRYPLKQLPAVAPG